MNSQFSSFSHHFCFVKISKNPFMKKKSKKNAKIRNFLFFFFLLVVLLRYVCVFCVMRLFAVYKNIFHEIPKSVSVHSSILTFLITCCPMENNLITAWSISVFRMIIYYLILFLFFNVFFLIFRKNEFFFSFFLYDSNRDTWKIK